MVREARFSIPVDEAGLAPRDLGEDGYADMDELIGDDHLPPAPTGKRHNSRRQAPLNRQTDRRHLAGADWLTDADFLDEE
jgi:hypothetical protein